MSHLFRIRILLGALAVAVLAAGPLCADETLPRRIIALHHPLDESLKRNNMHRMAEMPLNWLGYVVEYHDFKEGMPEWAVDDPDVAGVLTWFEQGSMTDPDGYLDWAIRMAKAGKKFLIFGDLGFLARSDGRPLAKPERVREFLALLGIKMGGDWIEVTFDTEIVRRDPVYYGFERRMGGTLPPYTLMLPANRETLPLITVRNRQTGQTASPALMSPTGFYVQTGWDHYKDPVYFRTFWHINPFAVFERVLGSGGTPVPDVTTVSGRRIYYSHIDGDGWRNVTLVKPFRKDQIYSARVVMERAIKAYPDLPVTVGPIVADLDPAWSGDEEAQQIARELFALPQVEMAHHTYSHPFEWAFFEDYTPEKEAPFVSLYKNPDIDAWGADVVKGGSRGQVSLKAAYDQPRGFGSLPFDINLEFGPAAEFVNRFAPEGKQVEIVLWSGDTSPTEDMIRASRDAGLLNLNGGDSRYDPEFPSVSYVPAIGFRAKNEQQIYASNSNENTYTDLWSDRYFGFRDLVHTLKNTERPRRLKPINVYYHMYSGERTNALNGLTANLDFVRTQTVAPIRTTEYARIAEGFYSTRFEPTGPLSWRVRDRGELQTIRFDRADGLHPDLERSTGVIGHNRHEGSLYVALDPAVGVPEIVLSAGAPSKGTPYLVHGRWQLRSLRREAQQISFKAHGYGEGELFWSGFPEGDWRLDYTRADGSSGSVAGVASGVNLIFRIPGDAIEPVSATIRPAADG